MKECKNSQVITGCLSVIFVFAFFFIYSITVEAFFWGGDRASNLTISNGFAEIDYSELSKGSVKFYEYPLQDVKIRIFLAVDSK